VTFVGETLTLPQIIGGILILGSTYIGEMLKDRKLYKEKDCIQM
jgi:drug/metabolite transporter (DMT)-like permease